MSGNLGIEVVVTGGNLRRADGGLIGDFAAQTIKQLRFDYAVIGCSALDEGGDILDFDIQEVGISKTIISQSEQVFLVADSSKFERKAPAKISSLAEVDVFFTDNSPPSAFEEFCATTRTRIELCKDGR